MTQNEQPNSESQKEISTSSPASSENHPIATGLGIAGGGVGGAALGRSIAGKAGAAVGGVIGAIAGGIAGNTLAELTEEAVQEVQPILQLGLGADTKPIELPRHYSWEELQALSKPQAGEVH
ncbi:MAG: hypothetical protein JO235_24035 [Chroococcidiopsidaceae cyanobacterium CP_BM_RX_35]|nr:hypothetical protein [Chroococcidiopsidaceae cyanobacterium CP_BM_RX_35]